MVFDRPKSVHNRCVIEVFSGVFFMLSRCFFDCSVGVAAFVIGLSQISYFFSRHINGEVILQFYPETERDLLILLLASKQISLGDGLLNMSKCFLHREVELRMK